MTARNEANPALPRSHFFITVARGQSARTFMARLEFAWAVTVIAPLLVIWFLGSTFFLVFHDDLVTALMLRQRDMQYGYEDRIATLRGQLDRDATRQLMAQRSVETKLDELTAREAELQGRSSVIARLDDQASHLVGVSTVPASPPARAAGEINFAPVASAGPPLVPGAREATPKPRPEAAILPNDGPEDRRPVAARAPDRVSLLSRQLDGIDAAQQDHVAALDGHVRRAIGHYHDALNAVGLSESRLAAHFAASGGPFVPLAPIDDGSPFARAAVGLQLTMSQVEQLSTAIKHVPFAKPLDGDPEITSPFGARIDPFLGRPALHTGVDLSEDSGTEVRATAPGTVTVAGQVSGYGTMIEIDHGAGLTTRYAHLSETEVAVGQTVKAYAMIGRVGATGRATGPHLHYETRIDGEPVDPIRFMAAGQRLRAPAGML
jgi:murein DD-endopeptidase MepM/ murein hydrolase activator NlpD